MGQRPLHLAIALSLVALLIATYVALTVDLFSWDVDITQWVQRHRLGPAEFLREWMFWMGLRGVAGALLALAVGIFWLARSRLEAVFLAMVAVPDVFNLLVRALVGRERPPQDLVDVVGGPQGFSFPSGTALHAILFYPFVLYLASRYVSSTRLRYGLWGLCTLYVLATGLWLIYNGRHWFTDVMGGYLYGVFYLLVIVAALKAVRGWVREGRALQRADRFPRLLKTPAHYGLRLIT